MERNIDNVKFESYVTSKLRLNASEVMYLCDRINRCQCVSTGIQKGYIPMEQGIIYALSMRDNHGVDEICHYPFVKLNTLENLETPESEIEGSRAI